MFHRYVLIYAVIINLIGLVSMYVDKRRARRRKRRIAERTLFGIGIVGGIGGIFIGMAAFHHKNRKFSFILKAMAILLIHAILLLYLLDVPVPGMTNLFI